MEVIKKVKPGQFCNIKTARPAKTKKGSPVILKVTEYRGARIGVNYDSMAQTKKDRAEGELPAENAGLPWGQWKKFPYVIEHKGQDYLRFYAQKDKVFTRWILDGKVVDKKAIESHLLASEKRKSKVEGNILTLTIKAGSVTEIK